MKINSKKMRDKIISLCKRDPTFADDDRRLIACVWYEEGWEDSYLYEHLCKVSNPETIRRTRARLVEEGVIIPSSAVTKARQTLGKQIKNQMKGKNNGQH